VNRTVRFGKIEGGHIRADGCRTKFAGTVPRRKMFVAQRRVKSQLRDGENFRNRSQETYALCSRL